MTWPEPNLHAATFGGGPGNAGAGEPGAFGTQFSTDGDVVSVRHSQAVILDAAVGWAVHSGGSLSGPRQGTPCSLGISGQDLELPLYYKYSWTCSVGFPLPMNSKYARYKKLLN